MVDATATPPADLPAFLNDWEKSTKSVVHVFQENAGPYKTVELHNFTFLGKTFETSAYQAKKNGVLVPNSRREGAGVCKEFRDLLIRAQRRICRAYVAEVGSKGQEPSAAGFTDWCDVRVVSGWQFRSRQHSRGAAVDIDAKLNPYVATKTGAVFGGESHKDIAAADLDKMRSKAITAYGNAFRLMYGKDMDPDAAVAGEASRSSPTGPAYDRFALVHVAVRTYFTMVFTPTRNDTLGPDQDFPAREFGSPSTAGSFLSQVKIHQAFLKGMNGKPLEKVYEEAQDDFRNVRLVMIYDKLKPAKPGFMNSGATFPVGTRDPCFGFLNFRKEIAVGIRDEGARWGAVDFGPQQNGDMMHFDIGSAAVELGDDPNPENLLFFK